MDAGTTQRGRKRRGADFDFAPDDQVVARAKPRKANAKAKVKAAKTTKQLDGDSSRSGGSVGDGDAERDEFFAIDEEVPEAEGLELAVDADAEEVTNAEELEPDLDAVADVANVEDDDGGDVGGNVDVDPDVGAIASECEAGDVEDGEAAAMVSDANAKSSSSSSADSSSSSTSSSSESEPDVVVAW